MSRKKAPFKDYEGSKQNDKHIRKTENMMLSDNYLKSSNSAKVVYDYMKLWACGNLEFQYAKSLAEKYMNGKTFLKALLNMKGKIWSCSQKVRQRIANA